MATTPTRHFILEFYYCFYDCSLPLPKRRHALCILFFTVYMLFPTAEAVYDCNAGRWGSQCTKTCGSCEGGDEFCQVYDGFCMNGCASGYTGRYCKETCKPGFHGQYCRYLCGNCSDVMPTCDPENGKCQNGCQPGYQSPYCKIPCEFGKWGIDCKNSCACPLVNGNSCGCDHLTGTCLECDADGEPIARYYKVKKQTCLCDKGCIWEDFKEYVPPSALDFPYKPLVGVVGCVALFVFGNFLWWWFMVRSPTPPDQISVLERKKKSIHIQKIQLKYRTTLQPEFQRMMQRKRASLVSELTQSSGSTTSS